MVFVMELAAPQIYSEYVIINECFDYLQERSRPSKPAKKSGKDPNAPKRPLTAYFLWLNENRQKIKDDNPGIGLTDIAKKGGELWGKLSDKSVRDNTCLFCAALQSNIKDC